MSCRRHGVGGSRRWLSDVINLLIRLYGFCAKPSRSGQADGLSNTLRGLSSSGRRSAPLEQHLNSSGPGGPVYEHVKSGPEQAAHHIFFCRKATKSVGDPPALNASGSDGLRLCLQSKRFC